MIIFRNLSIYVHLCLPSSCLSVRFHSYNSSLHTLLKFFLLLFIWGIHHTTSNQRQKHFLQTQFSNSVTPILTLFFTLKQGIARRVFISKQLLMVSLEIKSSNDTSILHNLEFVQNILNTECKMYLLYHQKGVSVVIFLSTSSPKTASIGNTEKEAVSSLRSILLL